MREETERLRKENEEKIRKMKERSEQRDREEAEKKEEERKKQSEKYSQPFPERPLHAETIDPKKYTKEMRDADLGYLHEWFEYVTGRTAWLIDELFVLSKRKMEAAKTLEELDEIRKWTHATKDQLYKDRDAFRNELHKKMEKVKKIYLYKRDPEKDEEEKERQKEKEAEQKFGVLSSNILGKLKAYDFSSFKDPKWKAKAGEYARDISTLSATGMYDGKKYQKWSEKMDGLHKINERVQDFLRRADEARRKANPGGNGGNGGGQPGPEKPNGTESDKEKAERIALQELGISNGEYRDVISSVSAMSERELIGLITKVLQCVNEKSEIKKAYRKWALEWHPDTRKT